VGEKRAIQAVNTLLEIALDGDVPALKLVVDKLYPTAAIQLQELEEQIMDLRAEIADLRRLRVA
jgi:hypothetical protein